jgi:DNA-binding response OmpR family regulator
MNKKILVLDDDEDILDILSFILKDSGYEIQTLDNGEKVFDAIRKFKPDLVLMDVMLAGMDGRVICKRIKDTESTHDLPVILISGTHDLARSLDQQGAPNDFVAKPFDVDFLLERIKNQLN